ncbi:hypothetical protein A3Q56_02900 [Intoshia linei]|uniref:Cilia- and flagella-associated protein 298 n=1 Tax=Intoshia linei TaxID=1819745 RepID=A0A177B5G4_9BILA|nr:hypothetical protein A3Q56_02900 [Intoshia linei]
MVKLVIKNCEDLQFLFETCTNEPISNILKEIVNIYNGRLKIARIAAEMNELADHGLTLPGNMQGLTDDQLIDLKLTDSYGDTNLPSGGYVFSQDDIGRRNGKGPLEKLQKMIKQCTHDSKEMISKKNIDHNIYVSMNTIETTLQNMKSAILIVYPMGLPPYDPIQMEFENNEQLEGTQASKDVIEFEEAVLWWAGKELISTKKLSDFIGKNEKCKILVKLQKKCNGAPSRESVVSEEEKRKMMMYYYHKQEELKKLEKDDDDSYLDSKWANTKSLKHKFQNLSDNIKFK